MIQEYLLIIKNKILCLLYTSIAFIFYFTPLTSQSKVHITRGWFSMQIAFFPECPIVVMSNYFYFLSKTHRASPHTIYYIISAPEMV